MLPIAEIPMKLIVTIYYKAIISPQLGSIFSQCYKAEVAGTAVLVYVCLEVVKFYGSSWRDWHTAACVDTIIQFYQLILANI